MSSDEDVVAAAFRPQHKETFITAAGVREEGGRGGGGHLLCCGFLFLTPITSYLGGKHQASILFNTFENSDFFFSLLCLPDVSVITASFFPELSFPCFSRQHNNSDRICSSSGVMPSSSVVATKGYLLGRTAVIFPYSALLMYIQWELFIP